MKKALSLLIAICMVLGMFPASARAAGYPALEYGKDLEISVHDGSDTTVTFTPDADGRYMFTSTGTIDTFARLYDGEMESIAYGDDCWSEAHDHEENLNFCIVEDLTGGVTYTLVVNSFESDPVNVHVRVSCGHEFASEVIAEPTCTEAGSAVYTCTVCGSSYTEEIEANGHSYNDDLICTACGVDHPTSGVWSDEYGASMSWIFTDGLLILTGEGEMPSVEMSYDYWGDWLWINNTPWLALPVTEVVVGNGITNVSAGAFKGCGKLEKVTLPASVTRIGQQAFEGCSALTQISFPAGLEAIDRQAFRFCSSLTEVSFPDGLSWIGHDSFRGCDLREVVLPAGLENDLDDAYGSICETFSENPNLIRVSIPGENPLFASDDQGALYNKDMTELLLVPFGITGSYTLPATVTSFDTYEIFRNCAGLEAILVEAGSADYYSVDGILYGAAHDYVYDEALDDWISVDIGEKLICCPPAKNLGAFTIGSDIVCLDEWAFSNCRYLTELTVPATCLIDVEYMPLGNPISGCTALQAVWFAEDHPEYVSDAEGVVFNRCDFWDGASEETYGPMESLEYLPAGRTGYYAIPEGVRYLREKSVWHSQLSAIRFPTTLEAYGELAVDHGSIEWMLFTGEKPQEASFFDGCESWKALTAKVYYPGWMESWEAPRLNKWAEGLTYIPYTQGNEPVWGGEDNPFIDVPADSFYAEPVLWAVEKGITNGLTADTFGPNATCNRAQVVTFLWRAAGCPEPESTSHSFVDVQTGSFYEKPVLWAVEKGITTGSDATHFNPTGECNRAQVVTFLYRTFESPAVSVEGLPFADVPAGSWYEAPIAWAVAGGITNGLDATHFGPNAICNRAQVVTFLYRAFEE